MPLLFSAVEWSSVAVKATSSFTCLSRRPIHGAVGVVILLDSELWRFRPDETNSHLGSHDMSACRLVYANLFLKAGLPFSMIMLSLGTQLLVGFVKEFIGER